MLNENDCSAKCRTFDFVIFVANLPVVWFISRTVEFF